MPAKEKLWDIHEKYIRRTKFEGPILKLKIRVTKITKKTKRAIGSNNRRIYIRTFALKHLYDKRPAEEFDFVIDHLAIIIGTPNNLYRNKTNKTGGFCITKRIDNDYYIAVIEVFSRNTTKEEIQIVTAFRIRDKKYLRDYELLRSWRDGAHSS
jgi:hypothetical protein